MLRCSPRLEVRKIKLPSDRPRDTAKIQRFQFMANSELHQMSVAAQGELHLDAVAERLRRRFSVHFNLELENEAEHEN
jgi:Elongation Factor G, domain III